VEYLKKSFTQSKLRSSEMVHFRFAVRDSGAIIMRIQIEGPRGGL
jgi:hypothetical protein